MTIQEQIEKDLRSAMVAKDALTVSALRLLKNAVHNQAIAKRDALTDEDVVLVLSSQAKQRKDSIEAYEKGGREDLAEKEKKELHIIERYLPEQLSDEEIKKVVQGVITSLGEGASNFGSVMGPSMAKLKGKADGKAVSRIVKELVG